MASNWKVDLQTDVIRGHWLDDFRCYLFYEYHYLVARRGSESYVHFYKFGSWPKASKFVELVRAAERFTPENKPGIWIKVRDSKPVKPKFTRDYRKLLARASG